VSSVAASCVHYTLILCIRVPDYIYINRIWTCRVRVGGAGFVLCCVLSSSVCVVVCSAAIRVEGVSCGMALSFLCLGNLYSPRGCCRV